MTTSGDVRDLRDMEGGPGRADLALADRVWDGSAPDEAPAWCHDLAALVRTAQGPAIPGELGGTADILETAWRAMTDDGPPPRRSRCRNPPRT